MCGEPVRTSSPGCSASILSIVRSANSWAVKKPLLLVFVGSFLVWLLFSFVEFFVSIEDDDDDDNWWWFVVDVTSVAKCIFKFHNTFWLVLQLDSLIHNNFSNVHRFLLWMNPQYLHKQIQLYTFLLFMSFHPSIQIFFLSTLHLLRFLAHIQVHTEKYSKSQVIIFFLFFNQVNYFQWPLFNFINVFSWNYDENSGTENSKKKNLKYKNNTNPLKKNLCK